MKRPFYRYVIIVTGIHIFAIMVLVVFSAIPNPFRKKEEPYVTVEFIVDASQFEEETPAEDVPDPASEELPVEEIVPPKPRKREARGS